MGGTYLLATLLYIVSFLSLWSLCYRAEVQTRLAGNVFANIVDGFRYIRRRRLILATLSITALNNLFVFSYATMVTPIAQGTLSLSEALNGIVVVCEGAGSFLGAHIVAATARHAQFARIYFYGSCMSGVGALILAGAGSFWSSAAAMLIAGAGTGCFALMQSTLLVLKADPATRSRVMGALSVAISSGPLGTLQIGVLAQWLGPQPAILVSAVLGLGLLAATSVLWPELRRRLG